MIGLLELLVKQFQPIVKGVLGILLRAKFTGDIPVVRPEIESLETKAGFRIAPTLR